MVISLTEGVDVTAISIQTRSLNVVLKPGSEAYRHSPQPTGAHSHGGTPSPHLAPGLSPRPSWNLRTFGGPTTAKITFVNRYLGGAGAWASSDMHNIDGALSAAMSDAALNTVIAQYFGGA